MSSILDWWLYSGWITIYPGVMTRGHMAGVDEKGRQFFQSVDGSCWRQWSFRSELFIKIVGNLTIDPEEPVTLFVTRDGAYLSTEGLTC